jgi:uncharacterized protein YraI
MPLRASHIALLIVALAGISASQLRAEETFPYTAYVQSNDVYVRSGPGENYYPVVKLAQGTTVEVYRHDPGGWYAIRPPEGSFSWVSAEFLKPTEGNIAVITGEKVMARVGTAFSDLRDVIQVRLDRGEEVEVIEAKHFGTGPAAKTWYKIAPPAGEFRWVAGKFLDRQAPEPETRDKGPENNLLIARHVKKTQREDEDLPADDLIDERKAARRARYEEGTDDEESPVRQTSGYRRRTPVRDLDDDELDRDEPRFDKLERRERDLRAGYEKESPVRLRTPSNRTKQETLAEELDRLDLDLSRMVAEEPTVWDFSDIGARAERAAARVETAVERGRARDILRKVARFEEIQERYLRVVDVRADTDRRNQQLVASSRAYREPARYEPTRNEPTRNEPAATATVRSIETLPNADERSGYDGVGRLMQVVARGNGAPQFALLDKSGAVRFYVTPAPGVNLQKYLGREVGVSGTIGYLPNEAAQHVTAKRIESVWQTKMR